jgi:phospholipid-binding lipoprotein MlaA
MVGLSLLFFCGNSQTRVAAAAETLIDLAQQTQESETVEDDYAEDDDWEDEEYAEEQIATVPDPLSGFNRQMFAFNNDMYYALLKPAGLVWRTVIPSELRIVTQNFFYNIRFPVRFFNSLFQAKWQKAWNEVGRFAINSTAGCAGLLEPSRAYPNLNPDAEDLGQTFAVWGVGNGFFITLPCLGPSTLRDLAGRLGDTYLDPIWYGNTFVEDIEVSTSIAIRAGELVNDISFRIGDYEAIMEAALDPYVALRNGYIQNRNKRILE